MIAIIYCFCGIIAAYVVLTSIEGQGSNFAEYVRCKYSKRDPTILSKDDHVVAVTRILAFMSLSMGPFGLAFAWCINYAERKNLWKEFGC